MNDKLWIGFDLDGTLAHYDHWRGASHIGEPVPFVVEKLKQLSKKFKIKIFTARVGSVYPDQIDECRAAITDWCKKHINLELPITSEKDQHMIACYDDRSKQVLSNTGICIEEELKKIVTEYEFGLIDIYNLRNQVVKLTKIQNV